MQASAGATEITSYVIGSSLYTSACIGGCTTDPYRIHLVKCSEKSAPAFLVDDTHGLDAVRTGLGVAFFLPLSLGCAGNLREKFITSLIRHKRYLLPTSGHPRTQFMTQLRTFRLQAEKTASKI
jgi:hypothetical protein